MKKLLLIILFSASNFVLVQSENRIQAHVTIRNNQEQTRMNYYDFDKLITFDSLPSGRHQLYIGVNDSCRVALRNDQKSKITNNDRSRINKLLSRSEFQFFPNDSLITDCRQFSDRKFSIFVTTSK
ncbi:MAG: hypothetical protein EOO51_13525 [Flavobacterium sp.]|nr:MAG: hypothetical protein EOO51_13525 [Flavobacterium sp.]